MNMNVDKFINDCKKDGIEMSTDNAMGLCRLNDLLCLDESKNSSIMNRKKYKQSGYKEDKEIILKFREESKYKDIFEKIENEGLTLSFVKENANLLLAIIKSLRLTKHSSDGDLGFLQAGWNKIFPRGNPNYLSLSDTIVQTKPALANEDFFLSLSEESSLNPIQEFHKKCCEAGLLFSIDMIWRFIASLTAKPFVILTGLSGSGKTKIAQTFSRYLVPEKQRLLVAVGADWINNEHLLGYVNALNNKEYIKPETGVLDLILNASKDERNPYFLILDEMNLSHVERYFADFLSAMESREEIRLFQGKEKTITDVPQTIKWPSNLFIIGTMNVDETTYMFSPKILDRAQVIEFRIDKESMEKYLDGTTQKPDFSKIDGMGKDYASTFLSLAQKKEISISDNEKQTITAWLVEIFGKLENSPAEFGFRTAHEILRFISNAREIMPGKELNGIMDFAIMQKILPKLHGSASILRPVLEDLKTICETNTFSVSKDKIERMLNKLETDGFASYPEA